MLYYHDYDAAEYGFENSTVQRIWEQYCAFLNVTLRYIWGRYDYHQQQRFEVMVTSLFTDLYDHNVPREELRNENQNSIVNISINLNWIWLFDKL